jgi:hypothetical protein
MATTTAEFVYPQCRLINPISNRNDEKGTNNSNSGSDEKKNDINQFFTVSTDPNDVPGMRQDGKRSTGGWIWPAAHILTGYLNHIQWTKRYPNAKVLEFGAGTGFVGLWLVLKKLPLCLRMPWPLIICSQL